ncbi:flagellar biosynthetic protein FliO [Paenibacillus beijingensis]|uniref:Flagellar protein n=1 Tax=Paenibacillus beijingensis TaxID=1126833 RepID=A0A0D5NMM7_9BACL|nr:flagellar biosynthetic protein FliO [Paenibacillus beijingensis]AJY76579.1 hypothetical protein VN24_20910 [Paenibacillus beijingensis]
MRSRKRSVKAMVVHPFIRIAARILLCCCPALFIGAAAAYAESGSSGTADNDGTAPHVSGGSMAGSLIWVVIALALVIALILAVIKWLSRRNQAWGTNRTLRSHGGVALGQNKSLQIVEAGGKLYVVGVAETITLLDKIEDPAGVQQMLESLNQSSSGGNAASGLTEWIANLRNRKGKNDPEQDQMRNASSFQIVLNRKLEQQAKHREEMEMMWKDSNQSDR